MAQVAVCWVDLDLQHEKAPARLSKLAPDKALALVLGKCAKTGLPLPSIVLWTGRGLAVKWYTTDILPKAAYPRWAAVQAALVEAFADLGADAQARDASRILRLVGTYNHKTGTLCEPLWARMFFGDIERIAFDDLADAVLPFTREQLAALRAQRAAQAARCAANLGGHLLALAGSKGHGNLLAFNPVRLAWLQVADYRKLAAMRPPEQRPEGWTNALVWLATSALAVAVWADADRWDNELAALCRELAPHWPAARIAQATATVQSRMAQMARGEWVDWQSKKRPPVYTPKHETIIKTLALSADETEHLAVIIPADLAKDRHRARQEQRRRAAGSLPRQTWLDTHEQRRAQARLLRAQGKTWREVATACGYPSTEAARKACEAA